MKEIHIWKTSSQSQLGLLPLSYDDLVLENHPVRIVNNTLDHINVNSLKKNYKGCEA
jgi:transposase